LPVGIIENTATADESIQLYPNPAQNTLYIETNSNYQQIEVLDVTGRKVVVNANGVKSIDVANLSAGTYWVRLSGEEGMQTKQFIKQ